MDVLFRAPPGALLAKPWVDQAGLFGLKRWYFPLSRLWAAAARSAWEASLSDDASDQDGLVLDHRRRAAATRHLATRASFYPLLFPTRPPSARWEIDKPADLERRLGSAIGRPDRLYDAAVDVGTVAVSRPVKRDGLREYWLRAPTPAPRLGQRPGRETLYAIEPGDAGPCPTLISGSGLRPEFELLTVSRGPATRLVDLGWRVVEPISPYHGLRAMSGCYGDDVLCRRTDRLDRPRRGPGDRASASPARWCSPAFR